MKKWASFAAVVTLLVSGCASHTDSRTAVEVAADSGAQSATNSNAGTQNADSDNADWALRYTAEEPGAFFPTAAGTTWDYSVTLNRIEPLYKRISYWPSGGDMVISTRESGRYMGAVVARGRRSFRLRLAVIGPASIQGPLRYPEGVEVNVLQDDLGIYRDVKRLFWAITGSGRYQALEVAVLDGTSPGAPHQGPWGLGEDGYSMRLMFFGARPGTAVSFGDHPLDRLAFVGEAAPGVLHFVRQSIEEQHAESDSSSNEELDGDIRDDMFFETGKGLTRLQQTVNGVPSMTWQLAGFQRPRSF